MIHIIKGFIILTAIAGSLYGLSRIVGNLIKDEDEDKLVTLFDTLLGLMLLFVFLSFCYVLGGGGK